MFQLQSASPISHSIYYPQDLDFNHYTLDKDHSIQDDKLQQEGQLEGPKEFKSYASTYTIQIHHNQSIDSFFNDSFKNNSQQNYGNYNQSLSQMDGEKMQTNQVYV